MIDLGGRRIVVVGAGGGGIGTAIHRMIGEAGGEAVGVDIDPAQGHLVADAADESSLAEALAGVGPLDGLVTVVGGLPADRWASVLDSSADDWDAVVRRNLPSTFTATRVGARRLVADGRPGSIVHLASIVGLNAMPFGASYTAAKAGVMTFTRTAALELGPKGIRVNAVAVGTIRSASNRTGSPPEDTPETKATIPIGRRGRPDDVAGAVVYLLSDLADFVTGSVLTVDGGAMAKPSYLDADLLPVFVPDGPLRAKLTD